MKLASIYNGIWIFTIIVVLPYNSRASTEDKSSPNHNCVNLIPKIILQLATDIGYLGLHGPSSEKRLKSLMTLKSGLCENLIGSLGNCELRALANLVTLPNPFVSEIFLMVRHIKCVLWLGPELRKRDIQHQCTTYPKHYGLKLLQAVMVEEQAESFEGAKELIEHGLLSCMELEDLNNVKPWKFRQNFQFQLLNPQITNKLKFMMEENILKKWFYKEIGRKPPKRERTIVLLADNILQKPSLMQNHQFIKRVCFEVIIGIQNTAIHPGDWMVEGGTPLLRIFPKIQQLIPGFCLQNNDDKDSANISSSSSSSSLLSSSSSLLFSDVKIESKSIDKQNHMSTQNNNNNRIIVGLKEDSIDNLVEKTNQLEIEENSTSEPSSTSRSPKWEHMDDDFIFYAINFFQSENSVIPLRIMENSKIIPRELLLAFDFACLITNAAKSIHSHGWASKTYIFLVGHLGNSSNLVMNLWRYGCRHLLGLFLSMGKLLFEPSLLVDMFSHQTDTEMLTFASILYDAPDLIEAKSLTNPLLSFIFLLQKVINEAHVKIQQNSKNIHGISIDLEDNANDLTVTQRRHLLRIILLFAANVKLYKTAHFKWTSRLLPPEKMQLELDHMMKIFVKAKSFHIEIKTL